MSLQYLRSLSLVVGDNKGNTFDLSQLQVRFQVVSGAVSTPKHAEMRIWNLASQTANLIAKEFKTVTLSAGYGGNNQQLFSGQLCRVDIGREDSVDSYCDLFCQDGDEAINFGTTISTIDAPWSDDDLFKKLMTDWQPYGITVGFKPELRTQVNPSAKTMQGKTSFYMDALAENNGCDFFIDGKRVYLIPRKGYLPSAAIPRVSSQTGLIGNPVVTIGGIIIRTLLNPQIVTCGAFQLDNSSVNTVKQNQPRLGLDSLAPIPTLDPNGQYKAYAVQHSGDTRGDEWYSDFVGVAIDGTPPLAGPSLTSVPGG